MADLEQLASVSVSGEYNEDGIEVSGSLDYARKVKVSETSVTYIGTYTLNAAGYTTLKNPQLTDTAQKHLKQPNGPSTFRDLYGDYYIAGVASICSLVVIYHCSTSSQATRDSFDASVSANVDGLFSGTASAQYSSAKSSSGVNVDIELIPRGANVGNPADAMPTPSSPSDMANVVAWFKRNLLGEKTAAKLQHYSQIDPHIPPYVPVDPDVFLSLADLRTQIATIGALHDMSQQFYADPNRDVATGYANLLSDISAKNGSVATNQADRLELIGHAQVLYDTLGALVDRHGFLQQARASATPEQGYKDWTYVTESAFTWAFGYNEGWSVSDTVKADIHLAPQDYSATANGPGYYYNTFTHTDPTHTIVGWRITANWQNSEGGSWEITSDSTITGSHSAAVQVASAQWRGTSWSFAVYWVDAATYSFTDVGQ